MNYYMVKFSGPFGYIKPWTAVRDELTYSQQFLTPSIIEGIRQKLDVNQIVRHRLSFSALDKQQEQTRPKLITRAGRNYSILVRAVMVNPELVLAFAKLDDAEKAYEQHLCLCRNEDILYPDRDHGIQECTNDDFDKIPGFELHPSNESEGFMVGYNRFEEFAPMYCKLEITDDAIRESAL